MRNDLICVILTGGKSRRMGRDKALLPLDGEAMSLRLASRFASVAPVYFSVDRAGRFPTGSYGELADRYPGQGPLNGIVSAFEATDARCVLLMATDMPDVSPAAARMLLDGIGSHDACLFGDEPLFAVYGRSCLPAALSCLEEGRRSMRALLGRVDALRLSPPEDGIFENLNTPDDWRGYTQRDRQEGEKTLCSKAP